MCPKSQERNQAYYLVEVLQNIEGAEGAAVGENGGLNQEGTQELPECHQL